MISGGIGLFTIPILTAVTGSDILSNALNSPIAFTQMITVFTVCRLADRKQNYLRYITISSLILIIGLCLLGFSLYTNSFAFQYSCLFIMTLGLSANGTLIGAWLTVGLNGSTKTAAGTALWNCVGNLGGLAGPQIFSAAYTLTNGYSVGAFICVFFFVVIAVSIGYLIEYLYPSLEVRQNAEAEDQRNGEETTIQNEENSNKDP